MTKDRWFDLPGETPPKGERPEMTREHYFRVLAARDELIENQAKEIAALKQRVNNLALKTKSLQKRAQAK